MATPKLPVYSSGIPTSRTNMNNLPINRTEMDTIVSKGKKSLLGVLSNIRTIKLSITLFLVGWLAYMTWKIISPPTSQQDIENKDRWYYVHRVWFGDESIVFMLFKIWYMVLVFLAISPMVGEAIDLMRLRPF